MANKSSKVANKCLNVCAWVEVVESCESSVSLKGKRKKKEKGKIKECRVCIVCFRDLQLFQKEH